MEGAPRLAVSPVAPSAVAPQCVCVWCWRRRVVFPTLCCTAEQLLISVVGVFHASSPHAVCVVVLVTAVNNYQKERQFRMLQAVSADVTVRAAVVLHCLRTAVPQHCSAGGQVHPKLFGKGGSTLAAGGLAACLQQELNTHGHHCFSFTCRSAPSATAGKQSCRFEMCWWATFCWSKPETSCAPTDCWWRAAMSSERSRLQLFACCCWNAAADGGDAVHGWPVAGCDVN